MRKRIVLIAASALLLCACGAFRQEKKESGTAETEVAETETRGTTEPETAAPAAGSKEENEVKGETEPATEVEAEPEAELATKTEPEPAAEVEPEPAAESESATEPAPEPRPEAAGEQFRIAEIDDALMDRIWGKSYKEYCTVPREDLRYLRVLHRDLEGNTKEGEMICNAYIAEDLLEIFRELYENGYPIEKIRLVDEYAADDLLSAADNNSSSFNFRRVSHSTRLSKHSYGLAVDINPLYNPYVKWVDGKRVLEPDNAEPYLDREGDYPYKITRDDLCCRLFFEHGFTWGGDWQNSKDYQHFELPSDVVRSLYPDY